MRTLIPSGPAYGKVTIKSGFPVSGPAHLPPQHVLVQTASAQVLTDLSTPLHLTFILY